MTVSSLSHNCWKLEDKTRQGVPSIIFVFEKTKEYFKKAYEA